MKKEQFSVCFFAYACKDIDIVRRHIKETQEYLKNNPTTDPAPFKAMLHAQTHELSTVYYDIEDIKPGISFMNLPPQPTQEVPLSNNDALIKEALKRVINSEIWPKNVKKGITKIFGYITYKIKDKKIWTGESFDNIAERLSAMGLGYTINGNTLKDYNNLDYDLRQLEKDPQSKDAKQITPILKLFEEEWNKLTQEPNQKSC